MFRHRQNSQKPTDDLYDTFRSSFPELAATSASSSGPNHGSASLTDALDVAVPSRQHGGDHDLKDLDPTPRGNIEPWRFTPSMLDPNSFAFTSFANQPPGYYTPTPGGTNTLYHPQAGDLHTPSFSIGGLGTPLSMPNSDGAIHLSSTTNAGFQQTQTLEPHIFQTSNAFAFQQASVQQHAQTFAPHHFSHDPSGFDGFSRHREAAKPDGYDSGHQHDVEMKESSPGLPYMPAPYETTLRDGTTSTMENFRYHVTLNAPTAMVKYATEIPVTYLNKGQAYSIAVVDTQPNLTSHMTATYRTFIRVSFEDEQQRQKPAACWQLWKEGRGTNEAHQRGGRLQAVEFVDQSQIGGLDDNGRPKIELESSSFDGFSVIWTPAPNGPAECAIAARFNFLSTDFSHSKGVKGIPVRLCAKTEMRAGQQPVSAKALMADVAYCKVKLFRDHGAERKLSNDVAHVKKNIDKLKQQISQVELGVKDHGKRKRSGSMVKQETSFRPGKVPKHKRTWSMSSENSSGKANTPDDDLQLKLASLQDMFTSTRPTSVLFLKGEEGDDPDLSPVQLSGDAAGLTRATTNESAMWDQQSAGSIVSPTPSNQSIPARHGHARQESAMSGADAFQMSRAWQQNMVSPTRHSRHESAQFSPSKPTTKVQRVGNEHMSGFIEAVGIDYTYRPPPERPIKPVACIYILPRLPHSPHRTTDTYHRAVYLQRRTHKDLVHSIAAKCDIDPTTILRTLRLNERGLSILLDDESVVELPEGQDMIAEFSEIHPNQPINLESTQADPIVIDGDGDGGAPARTKGWELRLLY